MVPFTTRTDMNGMACPLGGGAALSAAAPGVDKAKKQNAAVPPEGTQADKVTGRGEGFRIYDLRHTCATLLLPADVPAKVVSERLGHGSITLTLDTYSHVLPTMQKRAADTMGKLLGGQAQKRAEGG